MTDANKFQCLLNAADSPEKGLASIHNLLNSKSLPSLKRSFSIHSTEDFCNWPHSSFHQQDDSQSALESDSSSTSIDENRIIKPKRKRITPQQLDVLNSVFQSTYFPSTQLRISLGRQLKLSPRTIQIWFQNKRQAFKIRCKNEKPLANGEMKLNFAKEKQKLKQAWSIFVPNDIKCNKSQMVSAPIVLKHLESGMPRSFSLPGPEFTNNGIPFIPAYVQK